MDLRFKLEAIAKKTLPAPAYNKLKSMLHIPTKGRKEANQWLQKHCKEVCGKVLSIGSGDDSDSQGKQYRDYFMKADSYTTSEVDDHPAADLVIDARDMPEIKSESYDCIFCGGVLEHVDEHRKALNEITRVLKIDGILLLGVPFRQAPHMVPHDYWRFAEYGLRFLLRDNYEILEFLANDNTVHDYPSAYWVKAKKTVNQSTSTSPAR
jgi:SAM-dependent methyltransferase